MMGGTREKRFGGKGAHTLQSRQRVAVVIGTRPEAIKMAPVVRGLLERPEHFETLLVSTGQHREMLDQVLDYFRLRVDIDLELMSHRQSLGDFAARAVASVDSALAAIEPDVVLVQGDTVTVQAAALAARYRKIRVGHVEAGLRSFDDENPFPEEINRRMTGALATYHFAPTERACRNLLREGVKESSVFITGNTVVDALRMVPLQGEFDDPALRRVPFGEKRVVLVTAHRRENHGGGLDSVCRAVKALVQEEDDLCAVFPVHRNPDVSGPVRRILDGVDDVHLVEPAGYRDLLRIIDRSSLILSDSGGIQEEAPSFGTPLLILRDVTERPEVVEVGAACLVGTDTERILTEARRILGDPEAYREMTAAENPFGDGRAAERIVEILGRVPEARDVGMEEERVETLACAGAEMGTEPETALHP